MSVLEGRVDLPGSARSDLLSPQAEYIDLPGDRQRAFAACVRDKPPDFVPFWVPPSRRTENKEALLTPLSQSDSYTQNEVPPGLHTPFPLRRIQAGNSVLLSP